MRTVFILVGILTVGGLASAKMPWVKKAQAKGYKQVENCKSCHEGKMDGKHLTDLGQYLVDRKGKEKAAEIDLDWIKDYKAKK